MKSMASALGAEEAKMGGMANRLFYFAIPPNVPPPARHATCARPGRRKMRRRRKL